MKNKKNVLVRMAILVAFILNTLYSYAQPGKVNTNFRFDTTGLLQTGEVYFEIKKSVPVDSGRIVICGNTDLNRNFLVRVDSSGHIDNLFGFSSGVNIGEITSFAFSKTSDTVAVGFKHYLGSSGIQIVVFNKTLKTVIYTLSPTPQQLVDTSTANTGIKNLVNYGFDKFYCSVPFLGNPIDKILEIDAGLPNLYDIWSKVNFMKFLDDTLYLGTNLGLKKAKFNPTLSLLSNYSGVINSFDFDTDSNLVVIEINSTHDTTNIFKLNRFGTVDNSFQKCTLNGEATCISVQKNNTVLVGGTFTLSDSVGTILKFLLNIQSNGILDTCSLFNQNLGTAINQQVNCSSLLPNGDLFIGGQFDNSTNDTLVKCGIIYQSNTLDIIDTTCHGQITNVKFNINKLNRERLFLYPNPATNAFYINFASTSNENSVDVFDSLGNIIQSNVYDSENLNENGVDIAGYPIGIYFVKIIVDGELYIKKLIVVE